MSTHPTLQAPVNPQLESKFFSAPLEIRQEIYGYLIPYGVHAYLRQGKLYLSACVESCANGGLFGAERRESSDWRASDPVWQRRLRSSWGPHWKCEEVALRMNHNCEAVSDTDMAMLRACRRKYMDIVNFTVDMAAVHVTDLDTLDYLLQRAQKASSETSTVSEYLATVVPHVQNLSIVLRLPLTICKVLESANDHCSSTSSLTNATAWLRLCPAIAGLKRLQRLHIWLDHDDKSSWSVVNERAILSPLNELTSISSLNISVNLPKLHPRYETPESHFMRECPTPPFAIERRLRQRHHAVDVGEGQFVVRYQVDFPYLYDLSDYEDMSEDEAEEMERTMWKNGVDVKAEVGKIVGGLDAVAP
ncbi:hypothetical protein K469DRAFT_605525 [Zopfia rhizophila CBS 207.26]|uniref:DUF7730 domain-containing protein n=1 Tax=Zopfia rhizophila CBS 207.26 TaxID=1314779 RepID=A0A6A6DBR7_9PEZI|nr:hypothetical protein K469DRAFT_605525 [Zopfia rhizophila CBS 207.26]